MKKFFQKLLLFILVFSLSGCWLTDNDFDLGQVPLLGGLVNGTATITPLPSPTPTPTPLPAVTIKP
jgi:hypothetical protein